MEESNAEAGPSSVTLDSVSQAPATKRRGRPPKKVVVENSARAEDAQGDGAVSSPLSALSFAALRDLFVNMRVLSRLVDPYLDFDLDQLVLLVAWARVLL